MFSRRKRLSLKVQAVLRRFSEDLSADSSLHVRHLLVNRLSRVPGAHRSPGLLEEEQGKEAAGAAMARDVYYYWRAKGVRHHGRWGLLFREAVNLLFYWFFTCELIKNLFFINLFENASNLSFSKFFKILKF